jgi:hypothetical protein
MDSTITEIVMEQPDTSTVPTGATVLVSPINLQESCTNKTYTKVFLGGSIANGEAPNWQDDIAKHLADLPVYIFNPRRVDWDPNADNESKNAQIAWEFDGQINADIIIYYFDPNYSNPVTLLEFGLFSRRNNVSVIVYCPPEYPYHLNVKYTCKLTGPGTSCFATVDEAVAKLREEIVSHNKELLEQSELFEQIIGNGVDDPGAADGGGAGNEFDIKTLMKIMRLMGMDNTDAALMARDHENCDDDCDDDCDDNCDDDCDDDCECDHHTPDEPEPCDVNPPDEEE